MTVFPSDGGQLRDDEFRIGYVSRLRAEKEGNKMQYTQKQYDEAEKFVREYFRLVRPEASLATSQWQQTGAIAAWVGGKPHEFYMRNLVDGRLISIGENPERAAQRADEPSVFERKGSTNPFPQSAPQTDKKRGDAQSEPSNQELGLIPARGWRLATAWLAVLAFSACAWIGILLLAGWLLR